MQGRIRRIAALTAFCLLATGCMARIEEPIREGKPDTEQEFSIADIQPGDDFYGWCNAAELMEMHIPETEYSAGTLTDVQKTVDDQLEAIIHEIADSEEAFEMGSNRQLIHDLYWLAYDSVSGELDTTEYDTALANEVFNYIDEADSMAALYDVWSDMCFYYGCAPVFAPSCQPDLYDPSHYALYVSQYIPSGSLEDAVDNNLYASDVRDEFKYTLTQLGVDKAEAKERAAQMTYLVLDIGSATDFRSEDDDSVDYSTIWHSQTKESLDDKLQNLTYEDLSWILGFEDYDGEIVFENDEQLFMIDSLLTEENLEVWKDLTRCAFVEQYSESLPKSCGGTGFGTMTDADDLAVTVVEYVLDVELGEEYAARYFSEDVREDVTQMCHDIMDEYEVLIKGADWLSADGKSALISKLRCMECYIGADTPHEVMADDADLIGESLFETELNLETIIMQSNLSWVGEACDRNGFAMMSPQTVNACYDPQMNCINITAAILNAPIYDIHADYARNLGAIGTIIGHEISHAFDDDGMKYDASGAYRPEWMPNSDREAFAQIQDKAVAYYNDFTVLGTYHVKGRKTLGENLADISGVQCVLAIAETPEQQKRLFESYANLWKELSIDSDAKEQIRYDVHSPSPVRINAVVACFDEFYSIYDVQEGDALYVAPDDRIRRW